MCVYLYIYICTKLRAISSLRWRNHISQCVLLDTPHYLPSEIPGTDGYSDLVAINEQRSHPKAQEHLGNVKRSGTTNWNHDIQPAATPRKSSFLRVYQPLRQIFTIYHREGDLLGGWIPMKPRAFQIPEADEFPQPCDSVKICGSYWRPWLSMGVTIS